MYYSSIDGHASCFQFFATGTNTTINIFYTCFKESAHVSEFFRVITWK